VTSLSAFYCLTSPLANDWEEEGEKREEEEAIWVAEEEEEMMWGRPWLFWRLESWLCSLISRCTCAAIWYALRL